MGFLIIYLLLIKGLLNSGSDTISNILYNVQLNSYPPLYCSNVASEYLKNWDSQICAGDYSGK